MTYHICNLHDDRVLCVHRDFEMYYVRSMWNVDEHLTIFQTTDFEEAKSALRNLKRVWNGSWVIVDARGEVVT